MASYGHTELLRWLLANGADAAITDADGDTPLHVCETPECAALLVDAGADLRAQNDEGFTPFHVAAVERRADMVTWLTAAYAARGLEVPSVELDDDDEEDDEEDGEAGGDDNEDDGQRAGEGANAGQAPA